MIDQKTRDFIRTTIRFYLPDPHYKLFIFGSRAYDRHHPYSDVDVGIQGQQPVANQTLADIQESLEKSNLPVHVDVVDFVRASANFSRIAGRRTVSL